MKLGFLGFRAPLQGFGVNIRRVRVNHYTNYRAKHPEVDRAWIDYYLTDIVQSVQRSYSIYSRMSIGVAWMGLW